MSALSDLFQDIADAIRGQTGDTAKLSPAAFPAAIAAIEGGGNSAVDILPEGEFETTDVGIGLYQITFPVVFNLEAGTTYIVEFAGVAYTCEAAEATVGDANGVGVGNPALVGLNSNTDEPFLIGVFADGSGAMGYTTVSDSPITIRIYQEASVGGTEERWTGTGGTIKPTSWAAQTIAHNLGAIPDIVVIYTSSSENLGDGSDTIILTAIGFSAKFGQDVEFSESSAKTMSYGIAFSINPSNKAVMASNSSAGIEELTSSPIGSIYNATETTFLVGGSTANLSTNRTYTWYAFAKS